ncbi:MAG TPA: TonB family protein [Acidobacteriota bacterium]
MTSFEGSGGRDLTGKLLDNRYRVESKLGEGGMAAVYLAADERLGRHVVVKVPLEIFLTVSGFRERFAQEIHALIRLDHPFIGKILDRGEVSGVPFAVLQYLAGGSLVNRIEEAGGRLTPEQISGWLPRVAGALDFIHARNFLHRDIKPANILFDSERNVYIADFGIAKVLGDKEFTNLTQTGTLPGTVAYMAPEAGEHRPPGPSYDQYALAVVVYQALSGDLPHEMSDSPISALVQKIINKPVPLAQVCPHLPSGICEAVMQALSPSPEARFESCRAFAEAFAAGLQTAPAGVVAPAARATEQAQRKGAVGAGETVVTDETVVTGDPIVTDETVVTGDLVVTDETAVTGDPVVTGELPTEILTDPPATPEPETAAPPDRPPVAAPEGPPVVMPEGPSAEAPERPPVVMPKRPPVVMPERPPVVMPDESQRVPMAAMSKPKWRLPTLRLPQISLPRISLPEVSLPSVTLGADVRRRLFIGAGIAAAVVIVAGLVIAVATGRLGRGRPAGTPETGTSRPGLTAADSLAGPPIDSEATQPTIADAGEGAPPPQGAAPPPISTETVEPAGAAEDQTAKPAAEKPPDDPVAPATEPTAAAEPPVTPPAAGEQPPVAGANEPEAAPIGETRAPSRISAIRPDYPEIPFALAIEGEVTVEATIDVNGDVKAATVANSLHPLLDRAAIDAVQQWKYEPALVNGEPREYPLTATLVFALPPRPQPAPVDEPDVESDRQLDTIRSMTDIAAALEVFHQSSNSYPQALEELAPFMPAVPTLDGWDTPFWYGNLGAEYWLVSFGRDAAPGPAAPAGWEVGDAFEADIRLRAGEFDQVPEYTAAADPGPQPAAAGIETVPLTDDVIRPQLDPDSVSFAFDRTTLNAIGLVARRVSVHCLVLADGSVAEARVLQVDPGITPAATESAFKDSARQSAVDRWRFVPATRDGEAVAVWHLVHVQYQPSRQPAEDLAIRR